MQVKLNVPVKTKLGLNQQGYTVVYSRTKKQGALVCPLPGDADRFLILINGAPSYDFRQALLDNCDIVRHIPYCGMVLTEV